MFLRNVLVLSLVGLGLATYPVIKDDNDCIADKKFVNEAGDPFIKLCKQKDFLGIIIKQAQVVACLSSDKVTEVPIGGTFDHFFNDSQLLGFKMACKRLQNGGTSIGPEACLINKKVVEFGKQGVVGQQLCTCENGEKYSVNCKYINLFE